METKTAFVTGASGYLGGILSKKLKYSGWNVIGFDIKCPSHNYWDNFYLGDITEFSDLYHALYKNKVDAVFHLAGRIEVSESMRNPTEFWRINVGGTTNILHLMKQLGINNILFSSSASVYWASPLKIPEHECIVNNSVYSQTKHACEMAIEDSGLKHVIFRYFNLAGAEDDLGENHDPETHLIPNIFKNLNNFTINGDDYNTKDGTCIRDYVHVSDVADYHIRGAEYLIGGKPSVVLNLGTGVGYSILDIINIIEKELGIKVNYKYGKRRTGDPDSLIADITLAEKVLNYSPKHDIISILKTSYDWYKKDESQRTT